MSTQYQQTSFCKVSASFHLHDGQSRCTTTSVTTFFIFDLHWIRLEWWFSLRNQLASHNQNQFSELRDFRLLPFVCVEIFTFEVNVGKAKFSRVQDLGSKVEFLADVMCKFRTVKVATFSSKWPTLAGVQPLMVQDSMFNSFLATCMGKHTWLYTGRQANSRLACRVCTHRLWANQDRFNNKRTKQQNDNKEISK